VLVPAALVVQAVQMTDDRTVLAVDVGGRHVKMLATGEQEHREFPSGPELTASEMVARVVGLTADWTFDVVALGVPAQVAAGRVVREPVNLAPGWLDFDFDAGFRRPTRLLNDAAMQALGSYDGGRMLFLGLGTGLGSTMILDGVIAPMELGHLPFRKRTYEEYVGRAGRKRLGKKRWEKTVHEVVDALTAALAPDYVVIGGGLADQLAALPAGARLGSNANAFVGGFRLWNENGAASNAGR
jgi:polyphosphate glucokinase